MRSCVVIVAVALAWCGTTSGQSPDKAQKKLPVTLALKDKAAKPVNPKNAFPEITYTKSPDCTDTHAAWLVLNEA